MVVGHQGVVDLADDVAFQTPDDHWFGFALGGAGDGEVTGALIVAQPDDDDAVHGAVTAAVQPVAAGVAAGGGDGSDAQQPGQGGLGVQPVGIVAGGDQQLPGGVDPDAVDPGQGRCGGGDQDGQVSVEGGDLGVERGDPGRVMTTV